MTITQFNLQLQHSRFHKPTAKVSKWQNGKATIPDIGTSVRTVKQFYTVMSKYIQTTVQNCMVQNEKLSPLSVKIVNISHIDPL